ncbi:MAG: type II secretion system F family protein [Planctomycetaceae bacterium]|nr:type II secretion system F family protein [Planctomycetaceae bacterium]
MSSSYIQGMMFLLNRGEPIRQSSLLMVLSTGMGDAPSMIAGLKALAAESGPPWANQVQQLRALLEQGQTLSDALATTGDLLPEESRIAIRVAERSGTLKQVLADESLRLMNKASVQNPQAPGVSSILIWSILVGFTIIFLLGFQMIWIVPKLKRIYEDFGTELPTLTSLLVDLSDFVADYWYLTIFPAMCLFLWVNWKVLQAQISSASSGRSLLSQHFPRAWTGTILRLLAVTVSAQQSLSESLHAMLRELCPGRAARQLSAVRQQVNAGADCWESLQQQGFLNRRELKFLQAASAVGHPDWALLHLSKDVERRRMRQQQTLSALLTPVIVLLLGLFVLFIAVSEFLPLISLINSLSMEQPR